MKFEVTFLEKRGSAVMRRPMRLEILRLRTGLRFGRGTDNDVQLPDIRVDLTAAALFPRGDAFSIQASGPSPLRVNGRSTRSAIVGVGDEILIGPYRIELAVPPPDVDAALLIQLAQPLGDALARLSSQARLRLEGSAPSKRVVAWSGFFLVVLLCLVAPIIAHISGLSPGKSLSPSAPRPQATIASLWEPGEMSNSHRFFSAGCSTCHQSAFTSVSDKACMDCHGIDHSHIVTAASGIQESMIGKFGGGLVPVPVTANAKGQGSAIGTVQCTTCHQEHRGTRGIVISESGLCLQCHASLTESAPEAKVPDVPGFADHPQFRVRLVADAAGPRFQRAELGSTPPPQDRPGIKFSHEAHLVRGGFPALGYKEMKCADCHVGEPGGQGFSPITYKAQCQHCHELKFERQDLPWPNGKVAHGDDVGLTAAVWNFYAGKALQGGIQEAEAPAVPRQAPGLANDAAAAKHDASPTAWVSQKAEAALRTVVLDDKRGCAYCHFGTGKDGAFELSGMLPVGPNPSALAPHALIAPVLLQARFLPSARFDHAKHAAVACEDCHAARQAKTSGNVLIPGIANCQACHGAQHAKLRAESTCISCHAFHRAGLGPMQMSKTPAP